MRRPLPGTPAAPPVRTHHHAEFDVAELTSLKGHHTVSVCIPARDEEGTVGAIVGSIHDELVRGCGLVDEILVVDDHSTDRTAEVAAGAGARVIAAGSVLTAYGIGHGKGEAMWKSVHESVGDLIVWCDADVVDFSTRFVVGLLGPLLTVPTVDFVKGFYDRPVVTTHAEVGRSDRGGRVTELMARPLLSSLFPELTGVTQPLSGEYGGRRSVLERLPFVEGYGVDVALLIDVVDRVGVDAIAQVDLGERHHRNRPLDELSPMATAILQVVLRRAGLPVPSGATVLRRPGLEPLEIDVVERPPLVDVPGYVRPTPA